MAPRIGAGSAELSSSVVPTLAVSGHCASSTRPKCACSSEQKVLPSAAEELIEKPAGIVTTLRLIWESEGVAGLTFCGTFSATSSPVAESAASVDGFAASEGLKSSWSQQVIAGQGSSLS